MVPSRLPERNELVALCELVRGLAAVVRQGRPKRFDREIHLPCGDLLLANREVPPEPCRV